MSTVVVCALTEALRSALRRHQRLKHPERKDDMALTKSGTEEFKRALFQTGAELQEEGEDDPMEKGIVDKKDGEEYGIQGEDEEDETKVDEEDETKVDEEEKESEETDEKKDEQEEEENEIKEEVEKKKEEYEDKEEDEKEEEEKEPEDEKKKKDEEKYELEKEEEE